MKNVVLIMRNTRTNSTTGREPIHHLTWILLNIIAVNKHYEGLKSLDCDIWLHKYFTWHFCLIMHGCKHLNEQRFVLRELLEWALIDLNSRTQKGFQLLHDVIILKISVLVDLETPVVTGGKVCFKNKGPTGLFEIAHVLTNRDGKHT